MHILLLFSLVSLPVGEARVNGLADACVTIADQPLALYVNPALLTKTTDRKLLYNPVGFPFGAGGSLSERIFDAYLNVGFLGYSQPINQVGAGLAGFQDEMGGRGILFGAAYKFDFLHVGASLGARYHPYEQLQVRPAGGIGLAVLGIKFADVPGEISVAATANYIERFKIQAGLDYKIEFFQFLANFSYLDLFSGGTALANLAALFSLEDLIDFPLEVGGGWASDNRFGVLVAADLNLCRINLSYSNIPGLYAQPDGRLGFSLLFNIASTKEVAERLALLEKEKETKNQITSRTYVTQGIDLYNRKDYDGALHAFDIALVWDPSNKEALSWLEKARGEKKAAETNALLAAAKAAMRSEDYLETISKAEAVLAIDSTNIEARKLVEDSRNKYSQKVLAQASSNTGEINALYQQGLEQYANGDYTAATETWNKIAQLQPRSQVVATYQRQTSERMTERVSSGKQQLNSLESRGQWREALQLARQLQRLAPSDREISGKISNYESKIATLLAEHQSHGIEYFNQGSYVNAQKSFNAMLSLDPGNATAKQYLDRIKTKLQGKDADALYMQGVQAYTENRYEEAIRYWEQVLSINPNYENVARNIQRAKEKLAQLN